MKSKLLGTVFVTVLGVVVLVATFGKQQSLIDYEKDTTVMIDVTLKDGYRHVGGSGVYINNNGTVLTVAHLFVETPKTITITDINGTQYPYTLAALNGLKDLAILSSTSPYKTPYARLRHSPCYAGMPVMAVGNPLLLTFTVTFGHVSYVNRIDTAGVKYIQSDTAINPGNSGGPLFDENGRLIGINSLTLSAVDAPIFSGIAMSVSVDEIRAFLRQFQVGVSYA